MTKKEKFNWKNYTSFIGLILLIVLSILLSDTFLLPINLMNIAKQVAVPAILAVGMTFVIISGGIDLSVGSFVALSGVLFAKLGAVIGFVPSAILMLLFGLVVGLLYGFFITHMNVPPFIATLAGQTIGKGAALVITASAAVPIMDTGVNTLGSSNMPMVPVFILMIITLVLYYFWSIRQARMTGSRIKVASLVVVTAIMVYAAYLVYATKGLSYIVLISILLVAFFTLVLNRSIFGRNVYAIGGNADAARLAGISVSRNTIGIYAMCSTLACLGGVLTAARLGAGTPQVGANWELDAIAAVIIGGTSFSGGIGKMGGTVVGVLLMGVLNNLLSLKNIPADAQMIFKGLIILGAVVIDSKTSASKR